MTCKEKVAELLPWYVNDTLSEEERLWVEAHLKVCSSCQKSLQAMQWFSEGIEKYKSILPAEHIDPEKLVAYTESKNELMDSEIVEIEKHLTECVECKEELSNLMKVDADLRKGSSPLVRFKDVLGRLFLKPKSPKRRPVPSGRSGGGFGKIVFRPAFAYILVLILLYPAWLGVRRLILTKESPNIHTFRLKETLTFRGPSQTEEEVRVLPGDDVIQLTFSIPVPSISCRHDVDLRHVDKGLVLSQRSIQAIDKEGNFSVFLSPKSLNPGLYQLTVSQMCPGDSIPEEFSFSFKLVK